MELDQSFANKMVDSAIAECAAEKFAGDVHKVRKAILHGECEYCRCIAGHLVKPIGQYLVQVDKTIKAVYQVEPGDKALQAEILNDVHFLIWVEHKSAALSALAETLEAALDSQQTWVSPSQS
jgi:hypothetical protein